MGQYQYDKSEKTRFLMISIISNIILQLILDFTLFPNVFVNVTTRPNLIIFCMVVCPIFGAFASVLYVVLVSSEEDFEVRWYHYVLSVIFALLGNIIYLMAYVFFGILLAIIFGTFVGLIGVLAILIVPIVIFLSRY